MRKIDTWSGCNRRADWSEACSMFLMCPLGQLDVISEGRQERSHLRIRGLDVRKDSFVLQCLGTHRSHNRHDDVRVEGRSDLFAETHLGRNCKEVADLNLTGER